MANNINIAFTDYQTIVPASWLNFLNITANDIFDVKAVGGATGNGVTDDTGAITATITAAQIAGGGIVFLPPGTYVTSGLSIPSNVSLWGSGKDTIFIPSVGFSVNSNLISTPVNATNVDIGNFSCNVATSFTNSNVIYCNTGGSYIHIHDITMTNGGGFGVQTNGISHSIIERVNVLSANTIGIFIQNGTWNKIKDSYVTGVIGSHHFQIGSESNSEITGCNSYLVTGSGFGMNLNLSDHCRITNCFTQDSKFEGINITDCSNCTISNNTLKWSNNTISTDFGLSLNSATTNCNLNIIANNMINLSGKSGIALAATAFNVLGNIVIGNNIFSAGQLNLANDGGILLYQTASGSNGQNLVENNMVYGDGSKSKYGVLESSAYGGTPNTNRIALNAVFNVTVANVSTVGANTVSFIPAGW